jgi:hypothetical protein
MRRAGHSRLPRPCHSVRLQRVSQLLSLMSVTDERRIGYCGGNQCSGPGGLPLSLSCWRSSGAPLQQSGRDRRQTCRISKTSPAIPVACTDQTCRKQLGRDRLNSPLARPQRLQEPFELPLRAANLFSTGAAFVLRRERPGKKSRPDPPVHAFDAPSRKGRSRRSCKPRLRGVAASTYAVRSGLFAGARWIRTWSRRKRGLSAARHTSSRARPDRPQLGFGEPEMWSWRIALRAGPILIASSARICRGEDLRA